jgi:hypothetical protein
VRWVDAMQHLRVKVEWGMELTGLVTGTIESPDEDGKHNQSRLTYTLTSTHSGLMFLYPVSLPPIPTHSQPL